MKQLKNKVVLNSLWISVGQIVELAIAFIFGILITRYLTEMDNGRMNYAITLMNIMLPVATLSTGGVLINKLVTSPEKEGAYIGTLLVFRAISGVIASCIMMGITVILNSNDQLSLILASLQSYALLANGFEIFSSWYNFKLEAKNYVILRLITCIIVCIYKALILYYKMDVAWFCFSNVLDSILITLLCLFRFYKNGGEKLSFSPREGIIILKESYYFIFSNICAVLLTHVDKLVVQKFLGDVSFSHYYMALYLALMWGFVLKSMVESARGTVVSASIENNELADKRMSQLYSVIIWSGILVCVLIVIVSPYLFVILYGERYRPSGLILAITCWSVIFQYISYARNIWLILYDCHKYELIFNLLGIVINVLLNIIFTPLYGLHAAAIIFVFTQFFVAIILPLVFSKTRSSIKLVARGVKLADVDIFKK